MSSFSKAMHCSSPQLAKLVSVLCILRRQAGQSLADLARDYEAKEHNRARRLGFKEKLSSAVALTIPPTLSRVSRLISSSLHREEQRKPR